MENNILHNSNLRITVAAILTSDKVNFKPKLIRNTKIITYSLKKQFNRKKLTNANIYAPKTGMPSFTMISNRYQ